VARMNPLEDNYRLYHVINGKRTQIDGADGIRIRAGEWHVLSIRMSGDLIACYLDGKLELRKLDPTFTKPGKVGLWTKSDAQTYLCALYDEPRRNKVLIQPTQGALDGVIHFDDWNDYVIRCEGPRIRLWLNGKLTVDYTEPDNAIPRNGIIGLQIHGGAKAKAYYKDIRIEELPAAK